MSALQVNEPNLDIPQNPAGSLKPRLVGNLAYLKEFDNIALAGMATFQHQNVSSVLETQVFGQYKFVKLGVGYHQRFGSFSNSDFFSAALGIQFDKFSVGYSYDDDLFNSSRTSYGGVHQAWYIKGINKESGMSRLMNVIL